MAETYYVDATHGSDANAGTSENAAWQTLDKVNSFAFQPGDTVRFKSGEVWRGSLQCRSGVTYTRYGKGPEVFWKIAKKGPGKYETVGEEAKPLILRSVDLCRPERWEKVGDHLWATQPPKITTLGPAPEIAPNDWTLYCEGDAKAKLSKTEENGVKEFTLHVEKSGTKSTFMQLTNAPFRLPGNKGLRLKFRAKATHPFKMEHVSLMQTRKPWRSYGFCVRSPEKITDTWADYEVLFQSGMFDEKTDGRISFFIGGSLPEGCVFSFLPMGVELVEYDSLRFMADVGNIILLKKGGKPTERFAAWKRWSLEELKAPNDFFHDRESDRIYYYSENNPAEGLAEMEAAPRIGILQLGGGAKDVTIDGLAVANTGAHGCSGTSSENIVVRNCDFYWIGGSHLYTRGPIPTRYGNGIEFWCACKNNLVENCYFTEVYDTAMTNQGPDACLAENCIWRNNTIFRCEQAYEIWFSNPESCVRNIVFEGNLCVDTGLGWSHAQRPNKNATHLLAYRLESKELDLHYRNNRLDTAVNTMIWYFNPRLGEVHSDHNVFRQDGEAPESQRLFRWAGVDKEGVTFEEYRRATGNDAHSVFEK